MSWKTVTALTAFMVSPLSLSAQQFYDDDPIVHETQVDTPQRPGVRKLSDLYDRFRYTFHDFDSEIGGEALNVNTLDEVPDSSWFTNRHGVRRMNTAELVRGPDRAVGPEMGAPWMVSRGKSEGLTPGFEITDGRGDRYVIKLDPVAVPELSSAAEVIATKIFHALGYNVPENYVVYFDPETIGLAPGAHTEDEFGEEVPLTKGRLSRMLSRVPRRHDGTVRALASRFIEGDPLGPFRFHGTRSDDPNDIVPHEDRRELRGLRLFAAWLNHDDSRAHNTLDSWVRENGRRYVTHYLIDFGSAFGSGTVDLQLPNLSFHYWYEPELIKKNALGFGLHVPKYRKVKWPNFPEYRAVGRWESTYFDPEEWKPDYPNPAFVRMTARDAFWAAMLLMRFTPEELRAIVETGQYTNPDEERYFYETLVARQRKCGSWGILRVNPVDGFQVSGERLTFDNLADTYAFAEPGTTYTISWSMYDNADGRIKEIPSPMMSTAMTSVPIPRNFATVQLSSADLSSPIFFKTEEHELLLAQIRSLHPDHASWEAPVDVYLRFNGQGYDVVGIDRWVATREADGSRDSP